MTFADLPPKAQIFVDANTLVYHFQPHPVHGPACTNLLKQIETQEYSAFTSTHVLGELAHRLMTLEAATQFGWPSKVLHHLKHDPTKIQQLTRFQQAVAEVPQIGVKVLTISEAESQDACLLCRQFGLLINDALIVAVMQTNRLTILASNDADLDRVPGITRFSPA